MELIRLKPAREGLILRKPPGGTPLNAEGENVPNNSFWRRRLNDGDVIRVKDEPKSSIKKENKKD